MRTIRISFIGQCFVFGYRGVNRREAYPRVVARRIQAERPDVSVETLPVGFYHPLELPSRIRRVLDHDRVDIIVVDSAANSLAAFGPEPVDVGALPAGLGAVAEGARHGREVAKSLVDRYGLLRPLVDAFEQAGRRLVDTGVMPLVRRRQPPTLAEYERALEASIALVRESAGPALVLQGPSVFNPDESHAAYKPETLDVYRQVNAMVKRVAESNQVVFVDRLDVAGGANRSIFLDGCIRLSPVGHHLFGHALAEQLLRARLV